MANDLLAAIDKLASQTAALSSQTAALSAQVAVIRNLIPNTQSSPPPPINNGLLNLAARGFATSGDPDAHRPHLEALKQQLESTWKSHAVAGANVVEVVAMSLGQWEPRPGCSSPRLWIFLGGHFRTFMFTRRVMAELIRNSSSNCYLVAAITPETIDVPDDELRGWNPRIGWEQFADKFDSVPTLLKEASKTFDGRLAYAVVKRAGAVGAYPGCLPFYWHGVWAVATAAAKAHKIVIDPNAVVLRTRPDVLLSRQLDLDRLYSYFASGARGRHLMLGQDKKGAGKNGMGGTWVAQADFHAITSWHAFQNDIALPLEWSSVVASPSALPHARVLWERANANGWGYGRSAWDLDLLPPPDFHPCMDVCVCKDGSSSCDANERTCMMTVAESHHVVMTREVLRNVPKKMPPPEEFYPGEQRQIACGRNFECETKMCTKTMECKDDWPEKGQKNPCKRLFAPPYDKSYKCKGDDSCRGDGCRCTCTNVECTCKTCSKELACKRTKLAMAAPRHDGISLTIVPLERAKIVDPASEVRVYCPKASMRDKAVGGGSSSVAALFHQEGGSCGIGCLRNFLRVRQPSMLYGKDPPTGWKWPPAVCDAGTPLMAELTRDNEPIEPIAKCVPRYFLFSRHPSDEPPPHGSKGCGYMNASAAMMLAKAAKRTMPTTMSHTCQHKPEAIKDVVRILGNDAFVR